MENSAYQKALNFIHGRTKFKKIPTLERMQDFCRRLGNPERNLKMIHITGTNGKGSTTAFARQLLMEKGFKVGSFTSPFIIKFNDRFCINGKMISDDRLVEIVDEIRPIVDQMDIDWEKRGGGPTEFEIDTAIMFKYFAEEQVDYAVIEVGLGGTYDSTNVIMPLVSVITSVGKDHLKYLGPTIKDVARNKAGIIKEKTPVIIGNVPEAAYKVFQSVAAEKNAELFALNQQVNVEKQSQQDWGERFNYHFEDAHYQNLIVNLMGDYQINNAALALTACLMIAKQEKWQFSLAEIRNALEKTTWPGRFEKINQEPLIILDGAHNLQAVKQITKLLKTRFKQNQIYLIMSILQDKQPEEMLAELLTLPNVNVILTRFNSPRPIADLNQLKEKFPQIEIIDQWQLALVKVIQNMSADDILLFAGSLYFISEVREYFVNKEEEQ